MQKTGFIFLLANTPYRKRNYSETETTETAAKCKKLFRHELRVPCKDCSSSKSFHWVKLFVVKNFRRGKFSSGKILSDKNDEILLKIRHFLPMKFSLIKYFYML